MAASSARRDAPHEGSLDRISLLVLVAAGLGALGIIAVRLHDATTLSPLSYNEGWNAYHALRFQQTGSPYPPSGGLVMNNYTPIWFPLVAWMGAITESLVFAGRAVATLGFFVILGAAAMIGFTLRGRTGALASLVSVAFVLAAEAYLYIGIADPQLLAQGIAAIALLLAVRATSTQDPLYLWAMAVAVLAGFFKYNLAALPFALLIAALFEGRAAFIRVMLVAAAAMVFGYVLCALVGGFSWPVQLLSPRVYSMSRLLRQALPFITANALGFLIAFVGISTLPKGHVQRLLAVYLLTALPLAVFFVGGEGVAINIFFDTLVAMAVGISLAIGVRPSIAGGNSGQPSVATLPAWGAAAVLCAFLAVIGFPQFLETAIRVRHPEAFNERAEKFREDIEFLKRVPGNAVCYDLDLCYLAGKPLIYDPFNAYQALSTGAISKDRARALLHESHVQVIHISNPPNPVLGVPSPMAEEVAADFAVARTNVNGVFYVRRGRPSSQ
ncbi:MAG: hypothetical protein ABI120_09135 [Gemmatimonadaceae bacterium]